MGVATAVAVGGLAISAASTINSFSQASKQRNTQRQAEAAAARAMAEARKKLSINYAKERAIQKEPYELQREAMLSTGSQIIQAGQESDRGAETTAGKIMMAQNEAQAGVRTQMGKEMTEIEKEIIDENIRLRDLGVQLDLGEVEGQQKMAADAQAAATAYQEAGYKGIADTGQKALNMLPLFFGKDDEFNATDFSSSGGQVTTSNSKNMVNNANPAFQSMASNRYPAPPTAPPAFGPQMPQQATPFGIFGVNWSGVGSDRKLKKNITKIGQSQSGLNIYSFEYIDEEKFGKGVFQGVMSDEIPQYAVIKGSDGFDRVNYSLLDIEFKKI
jgi:hypothetical protein